MVYCVIALTKIINSGAICVIQIRSNYANPFKTMFLLYVIQYKQKSFCIEVKQQSHPCLTKKTGTDFFLVHAVVLYNGHVR